MSIEHKTLTGGVQSADDNSGVVEALVSITGIKDNVGDIIHPGAYEKTLLKRKPKGAWSHEWSTPVSRAEDVKELMPGDPKLPSALSDGTPWPEDAGALYVKARFNLNTTAGRDAYENVKFFGEDMEWSIGYNVPKGGATKDSSGVRHIKNLELFEFSPVLFGAASEARSLVSSIKSMFGSEDEWKKALTEELGEDEEKADETDEVEEKEADEEVEVTEKATEEKTDEADDSLTDEEMVAILTEEEKSDERSEAKTVALTPVLLEKLNHLQAEIKSILDAALVVEVEEEIESKSIEDALNDLVSGDYDEKAADEIAGALTKFDEAVAAKNGEEIKQHSIAVLDLIDAGLADATETQERELKTLAKAIGEKCDCLHDDDEESDEEEEKSEEVVEEVKTVSVNPEDLKNLLKF